jgi:hypothetical protein
MVTMYSNKACYEAISFPGGHERHCLSSVQYSGLAITIPLFPKWVFIHFGKSPRGINEEVLDWGYLLFALGGYNTATGQGPGNGLVIWSDGPGDYGAFGGNWALNIGGGASFSAVAPHRFPNLAA